MGDVDAEGAAREGKVASVREEEDEAVAKRYHDTVLSGNMRQAVRQATNREGEGVSSRLNNEQRPGDRLQRFSGRSIKKCMSPPWKIPCDQP